MNSNRINIAAKHMHRLTNEFDVSRQTVYNALRRVTGSDLAKRIRRRAKELLREEAESAEKIES